MMPKKHPRTFKELFVGRRGNLQLGTLPRLSLSLLLLALTTFHALTEDEPSEISIALPFGFFWGQTKDDAIAMLNGGGVEIVKKDKLGQNRELWELKGFIRPLLAGVIVYFTGDYLEEVELQFGHADWKEEDYTRHREKVLKRFNEIYGEAHTLSNENKVKSGISQHILAYEWEGFQTKVRLCDFSAEAKSNNFRTLSIHYKYFGRKE